MKLRRRRDPERGKNHERAERAHETATHAAIVPDTAAGAPATEGAGAIAAAFPADVTPAAGAAAPAPRKDRERLENTQSVSTVITAWLIAGILLLGLLGYELIDPTLRIGWAISIAVMISGAVVPLPLGGFFGLVGMLVFAAQLLLRTWAGFQEGLGAWETALLLPLLALPLAAIRSQGAHLERTFGAVRRMEAQAIEVVNRYTGLPGPKMAPRFAAMAISGWKRYDRRGALIEIQITNFEAAKELMSAADFLREMNELADAIRRHLREADLVLQPSNERIWVLADLTGDPSGYAVIGQRLQPVATERPTLQMRVRVARYPDDGETIEELEKALGGSAETVVHGFLPYLLGAPLEDLAAAGEAGSAKGAWPVWHPGLGDTSGRALEAPIGDRRYRAGLGLQWWRNRLAAVVLEWPAASFQSPDAWREASRRLHDDLVAHYAPKVVARNNSAQDGRMIVEIADADGNRLVATAAEGAIGLAYVAAEFEAAIHAPAPEPAKKSAPEAAGTRRAIKY
jgi:hypothetical protein